MFGLKKKICFLQKKILIGQGTLPLHMLDDITCRELAHRQLYQILNRQTLRYTLHYP